MENSPSLGKYRIIRLLATGGMGEVFLARQEGPAGFSKRVVLKKILRHLANDQGFVDLFLNEARLAAHLSHPNIVQIFELGQEDDTWFIAMEYVDGWSLRTIRHQLAVKNRVMAPPLAARLCAQALHGLEYAHRLTDDAGMPLGIVHRDISPDNVLVSTAGVVKLVDFGIAKAVDQVSTTRSGTLKGKFAYMAPEQLAGNLRPDARADIYAMGVLLYELVTGARPFTEGGPDLVQKLLSEQPTPAIERNPELPVALDEVIMKALAREPADRWASADAMATALESFIQSTGEPLAQGHVGQFLRELFQGTGPASLLEDLERRGPVRMGTAVLGPSASASVHAAARAIASTAVTIVGRRPAEEPPPPEPAPPPATVVDDTERFQPFAPTAAPVDSFWRRAPGGLVLAASAVLLAVFGGSLAAWMSRRTEGSAPAGGAILDTALALAPEGPPPTVVTAVAQRFVAPPPPSSTTTDESTLEPAEVSDSTTKPPRAASREAPRPRSRSSKRFGGNAVGHVSVRVNPWAEVVYEGRSLGVTPLPPIEVPSGVAYFTLKNQELSVVRRIKVVVTKGGNVVVKENLFDRDRRDAPLAGQAGK